ncbi:hypothetical protein ALI22I_06405 [Saccharothrix sp. ALI-22-I]|nr:hypothetical protein ALI22I_06405 [Saccharothrix sp. ALI-22-I]
MNASASSLNAVDEVGTVAAEVDRLLMLNPGAEQVSSDTIRFSNGAEVTFTPASSSASRRLLKDTDTWIDCEYLHLCIADQDANIWSFFKCQFVNIGSRGWSDRIRWIENNQSRGTGAVFYNWTGSRWEWVGGNTAYYWSGWMSAGSNGFTWADGVDVCNNHPPA